jgi:hypothetical protein
MPICCASYADCVYAEYHYVVYLNTKCYNVACLMQNVIILCVFVQ